MTKFLGRTADIAGAVLGTALELALILLIPAAIGVIGGLITGAL